MRVRENEYARRCAYARLPAAGSSQFCKTGERLFVSHYDYNDAFYDIRPPDLRLFPAFLPAIPGQDARPGLRLTVFCANILQLFLVRFFLFYTFLFFAFFFLSLRLFLFLSYLLIK